MVPGVDLLTVGFNDAAPNRAEERDRDDAPAPTFAGFNDAAPNRAEERPSIMASSKSSPSLQ